MVETKNTEQQPNAAEVQTLVPHMQNQVHVSERGGLCFFKDKILTAADDTMLKVHNVGAGAETCENGDPIDLDHGTFAISSNNVDVVAIGGESKQAVLMRIQTQEDGTYKLVEGSDELAMCFDSPVTKLEYCAGGKLLGVSQDNHVQLMDIESKKVTNFVQSAHEGSVRNAAVDTHFEHLATTGCDGQLKVTKIGGEPKLLTTVKVHKNGSVSFTSKQQLGVAWSPSGDRVYAAGDNQLTVLSREDNFRNLSTIASITHTKEISLVVSISETCVATAGLDKLVKLWKFDEDMKAKLVASFKADNELMDIKFNRDTSTLAFLDNQCTLGAVSLSSSLIEGRVSTDTLNDDIDLDAIDAAMIDEEDDNIDLDDMQDALSEQAKPVESTKPAEIVAEAAEQHQIEDVKHLTEDEEEQKEVKKAQPRAVKRKVIEEDEDEPQQQPKQKSIDPYGMQSGIDTQTAFLSNCVYDFVAGKHRILSWNTIGVVGVRSEFQYSVVDVDFANKNFHRNLVLPDTFGVTMAALNYNGVLMASQSEEKNEDAYEEDDLVDDDMNGDDRRIKSSNIQFKPFNEWKDAKEWNFELKNGENTECLAVGSGWNAVLTNFNYVRVFSNNGVQRALLCQAHPVVTMAGYENFLAIVYQSGPAFNGYQPMRMKVLNMATRENQIIMDADCAVTPTSELRWFGFSEEGQLFSYDGLGIVRSFSYGTQTWTPRHDFKMRHGHLFRQLWICGVAEQQLYVIEMPKDHEAPAIALKSSVRRFPMRIPLLEQEEERPASDNKEATLPQTEAKLQQMWLHLEHEIFRKQNWESLKHFRSKYDNEFAQSETILDASDIAELKRTMDKEILNAIRLCVQGDEKEKVFDYMDQLHFKQSLTLCVKMCEKLKAPDLAQKVNKFIGDKETKEVFMKQLPADKLPINMQGRRIQANNTAAPVSFSEQFKNDKPQLLGSSQVSLDAPSAQIKQAASVKSNPFAKKIGGATSSKASGDVFADLKQGGTSKLDQVSQSLLQKRPYNGGNAQPNKQRKLFS